MTRQAYIAELSQLLFYMTVWDKAEVLEKYTNMLETCENEAALIAELGPPMKLAVTLHRSYEPTPEPTAEELAARAAATEAAAKEAAAQEVSEEAEETPAEEAAEEAEDVPAEEAAEEQEDIPVEEAAEEAEDVPAEEAAEEQEDIPVEEAAEEAEDVPAEEAAEEAEDAPVEDVSEEAEVVPVEEAAEEPEDAPVEDEDDEVVPQKPQQPSMVIEMTPGKENIFAEIFNAATEAQSAVIIEEEQKNITKTERKARYWFLIPYTILAVLVAIPVELCLIAANLALAVVTLPSLVSALYLGIFHFLSAPDLATKLIVGGMAVVMIAVMIGFGTLTLWFFRRATTGFVRFLHEVADKHGYREVEVQ